MGMRGSEVDEVNWGFIGAVAGFVVCFVLGRWLFGARLRDSDHHRADSGRPSLRVGLVSINIAVACLGAWLGYQLLRGY